MISLLKSIKQHKLRYLVNLILVIIFLLPFIWTLSTSLKATKDIITYPPHWIPKSFTFEHYKTIWDFENGIFTTYFFNSILITLSTIIMVVLISSLAGYGFSKLDLPFKNVTFIVLLAALMIPFHSLLIPLYTLMKFLGLLNTRLALMIIYVTFQIPFGIYMMKNSFDALPNSLREAALVDGSSEFKNFYKVMLPLVWPGMVTVAIFSAYTTWNDFIIAVVFGTTDSVKTLNVGLTNLAIGEYGTDWGMLSSGAVISFIPIIILFAFLQRYFIAGIIRGSVK